MQQVFTRRLIPAVAMLAWAICNQQGSGITSLASYFVPAYRNIVTSMRSVSGANFKFVWNPLESSNVSCPASTWKLLPR